MPDRPFISVIIAVLNNESTIRRCLESISSQTYLRKELIVIDGGSTDGTVEVLREHGTMIDYWQSEPDRGIYHAWNKALSHARGEWIYFLGADDYLWSADVLEQLAVKLKNLPGSIALAYGRICIVSTDGQVIRYFGEPWEKAQKIMARHISIPHQGTMHRRRLFEQYGRFDESFRIAGDYEFLLRVLRKERALFIPGLVVAAMEYGGIATKREHALLRLKEDLRARKKNKVSLISWYWLKGFSMACLWNLLVKLLGQNRALCLADRLRHRNKTNAN